MPNFAVEWRDERTHVYSYDFPTVPGKGEVMRINGQAFEVTKVSYDENGFPTLKTRRTRAR